MYYSQLGGETGVGNPQTAKMKNVFRLLPIILIPITISFPTVSLLILYTEPLCYNNRIASSIIGIYAKYYLPASKDTYMYMYV